MKTEFRFTGLSKGNRLTLMVDDTDRDWFHARTRLPSDRFEALFDYFKKDKSSEGSWVGKTHIAVVEHDGIDENGIPTNPVVTEIKLDL